jgi:hypothetical protein
VTVAPGIADAMHARIKGSELIDFPDAPPKPPDLLVSCSQKPP